ncbi:MAG: hypothetical protein LBV72_00795 [Tannerella sp.]|jgi:hypothetical protein|nr:hypothetical protein [Tannerella sp.]
MKKKKFTYKVFIAILLVICAPGLLKAEYKLGIIEAPGQTVIVRANPSETSEQLLTLNHGDFFDYESPTDSHWIKISIFPAEGVAEGYIPKANIRLVESLTEAEKKNIITDVLNTQQLLAEDFQKSTHETLEKNKTARKKLELHDKKKYIYALSMIPSYLQSTDDDTILQLLLATIHANEGSANELPATILAQCLIAKPALTIGRIKGITDKAEQTYIVKQVEFGLDNYYECESVVENLTNRKMFKIFIINKINALIFAQSPRNH